LETRTIRNPAAADIIVPSQKPTQISLIAQMSQNDSVRR
jgi:hypothetical protein